MQLNHVMLQSKVKHWLKIFGDRSLDHICNTRLRNLKEKTLRYHFKIVHIPGVKNKAPDTLSRHPTGDRHPPKMVLHDDIHSIQDGVATPPLRSAGIPSSIVERRRSMLSSDDVAIWTCSQLMECRECRDEMSELCSWSSIWIESSWLSVEMPAITATTHQRIPPIQTTSVQQ